MLVKTVELCLLLLVHTSKDRHRGRHLKQRVDDLHRVLEGKIALGKFIRTASDQMRCNVLSEPRSGVNRRLCLRTTQQLSADAEAAVNNIKPKHPLVGG